MLPNFLLHKTKELDFSWKMWRQSSWGPVPVARPLWEAALPVQDQPKSWLGKEQKRRAHLPHALWDQAPEELSCARVTGECISISELSISYMGIKRAEWCGGSGTLTAGGDAKWGRHFGRQVSGFWQNHTSPWYPAISLLAIYPKELRTHIPTKTCTRCL